MTPAQEKILEIIRSREKHGISTRELAMITGATKESIRVQVCHIRKHLRGSGESLPPAGISSTGEKVYCLALEED